MIVNPRQPECLLQRHDPRFHLLKQFLYGQERRPVALVIRSGASVCRRKGLAGWRQMEDIDLVILGKGGDKVVYRDPLTAGTGKVCMVCGNGMRILIEAPCDTEPSTVRST